MGFLIVHPIAFPLFALGITLYVATNSLESSLGWIAMAIVLTSLPITFLVALQVIRRKWTDLDVSVRKQRSRSIRSASPACWPLRSPMCI